MNGWRPDGTGIHPGGDTDGGIPGCESYSVRFGHPELPRAAVIRTAYAAENTDDWENPGGFIAQVRTEWIVCADPEHPRETETGRDGDTYDDWDRIWATAAEAEADARDRVIPEVLRNAYCLNWNGQLPY